MTRPSTIRLGRALADKGKAAEMPKATFRRGKVVSVDAAGVPTVNIGDDETPVAVFGSDSNYVPKVNDAVDLKIEDQQVTILGKIGTSPSVFAGITQGIDAASAPRGAITYGTLASPGVAGPAVTVLIGDSGKAVAIISCKISATSDNDGGAVGVALSGPVNTLAAADGKSLQFEGNVNPSLMRASAFLYYEGLAPGSTTFTMQYKDLQDTGTDVDYALREIVVLPL